MAGARPQQRASGLTAVHVWLIVFVTLWLGTTVVLVLLFTGQEQLRQEVANAQNRVRTAVGSDDRLPAVQAMQTQATGANKSLVKLMYETMQAQAARLTGNRDASPIEVETAWANLIDEIASGGKVPAPEQIGRGIGSIPALRQMYEWYIAENEAKTRAAVALDQTNKALEETQGANRTLEEEFKGKLADLEKQVASIAADKDSLNKTKTAQIDDLSRNIAAKKDELTALSNQMRQQSETHQTSMAKYEETMRRQAELLAEYRSPGPAGTNELDIARQPVGKVLRAMPGDAIVHIDLGNRDGVKLGMTFSVYSFGKPVPVDGRGKSTLEVVSVGQHTAECRVVTPAPPDEPILEDDLVGNILLSRTRAKKPKFVVIGNFDTDYDGTPDAAGYEKIIRFIERFGGQVVDEVDATVDYVVRGRQPEAPKATAEARRDPMAPTAGRRAARDSIAYDRAVRQGVNLGIPRLSQDQFFNFVGLELARRTDERLSP